MTLRKSVRRALTALSLLLALGGVALMEDAAAGQAPPAAPAAAPAPALDPAEVTRRAQVFARLGEVTLTLGEIEDDIQRRSPFARRQYEERERLVAHARELFRAKLLANAAAERGYGSRPAVRSLVDRHLVAAVVRRQVDELNGPGQITEADARAYFTGHPELFVRAEQRRVSHILVETREQAEALLTEVRAGDLRVFRRLAQEQSLDTETNQRGGDLGYFAADGRAAGGTDVAVNETIARFAFTLTREAPVAAAPLEVSTTAGTRFSVVRLTGVREGANPSFEEVEASVRRRLAVERRDGAYRAYVTRLRQEHQVEMRDLEVLRTITLPPPPMPVHQHRGAEPEAEDDGDGHMAP